MFDMDTISKDAKFIFLKNNIRKLGAVLRLKNEIVYSFYNNLRIDSVEALCILLKR